MSTLEAPARSAADPTGSARTGHPGPLTWLTVGLLSTVAGAAHLSAAAEHAEEGVLYGLFFYSVAAAQLLFPLLFLVTRARPVLALLAIAGNVFVVAVYVLSRTLGVPVGQHAWLPEEAGTLDLATTAAAVALVICLLTFVPARLGRWVINALALGGLALWTLRFPGLWT